MRITTALILATTLLLSFNFDTKTSMGQNIGDQKNHTIKASVRTSRGSGGKTDEQIFQVPNGWRVVKVRQKKSGYGYKYSGGVSYLEANSQYYSVEQVKNYYKELIDLAARKGQQKLAAKLNMESTQHESYLRQLMSSHKTVVAKAYSSGGGNWNRVTGGKGAAMSVTAVITVEYVGTPKSYHSKMAQRYSDLYKALEGQTFSTAANQTYTVKSTNQSSATYVPNQSASTTNYTVSVPVDRNRINAARTR